LAQLVDTRFLLIKLIDKELKITNEFISPGFTVDSKIANGFLYVLDTDSGLTVFKNPDLLTDTVRIPRLLNHTKIFVDSSKLVLHSVDGTVDIQNLKNFIPIGKPISTGMTESFSTIYYAANRLYGFNNSGLKLFDLSENNLKLLNENKKIIKVYKTYSAENKLFVMTTDTKLFEINLLSDKEIQIMKEANIGFLPASFCSYKDKLVTTEIKSSRLLSIFDPYNQTNLSRLALWRGGIEIFKNYPLFGVGDIGLENYYRQYKQPYNKEIQGHLHNNFFHILATLGLFGLLAVCFLFYRIIMINIKIYKTVEDESFISSYALGVIGAFFAFLVSGLTELNFGDQEIITLVWFTFGLNIAFYNLYKKQQNILTLKQD
jgi:hypothetical protein